MIPRTDSVVLGLAVSVAISVIAYFLLLQLGTYFDAGAGRTFALRPRTLALLAICLNVIPMNVFRRSYRTRAMKGLLIGVMLMAAAWFFYYGRGLLNG